MSASPMYYTTPPTPGEPESAPDPEFQLSAMWTVLRRHRFLILGLTLLGAVLAFALSKISTRTYTSTATVEVSKPALTALGVDSLTHQPQSFGNGDEMVAIMLTEQNEMQSASVASKVIEQLGLASVAPYRSAHAEAGGPAESEARRQELSRERMLSLFQARLKVAIVKDTKLMEISFTDNNPERAAAGANAVIKTYVNQYAEERSAASEQASSWLARHLVDLRSQVLASEKAVNDYEARTGIVGNPDQASAVANPNAPPQTSNSAIVERYIDLNRALTLAQTTRAAKQAQYESLRGKGAAAVLAGAAVSNATTAAASNLGVSSSATELATAGAGITGPEVSELSVVREQRESLVLQVASKQGLYGPKSPLMEQLNAGINATDHEIQMTLTRIRERARDEYTLARANEDRLRELVNEQQAQVSRLTIGSNQLALLQQEANSKRALYQELSSKLEQTTAASGVTESNITIIDPARQSLTPSSPKTGRNVLTGAFTGLVLGLFVAFLMSYSRAQKTYAAVLFALVLLPAFGLPPSARAQSFPAVPANLDSVPTSSRRASLGQSQALQVVPEDFSRAPVEPGYLMEMIILGAPEMSATLRVDGSGDVNVPLVGPVHVAGKTPTEAQAEIAQAFTRAQVLNNPQVTLNITQYAANSVSVLGEVQSPGRFQVLGPRTLEEVVALAGGETNFAGNTIEVDRKGSPPVLVHYAQGESPANLRGFNVQNGDSIFVRRAGVIYVLGAVNRPGGYIMVNRGELNVLQAIALASGTTLVAKDGSVYVVRTASDGSTRPIPVNFKKMSHGKEPPFPLQVNDILYVPSSLLKTILINGSGLISSAATAAIYRAP